MSTHARPLAVWLAAASDTDLERLFARREVRPDASWHDFFDAAEALLEPSSLERVLQSVGAAEAAALLGPAPIDAPRLAALGVVTPEGTLLPPVSDAVSGRRAPDAVDDAPPALASDAATAHAAERAFTTVAAIADLLLETRETPFALLAGGAVNAAERRRATEAGIPAEHLASLLSIAASAGLARPHERTLRLTRAGDTWLRSSALERWAALVLSFRDALPRGIRAADGGWNPPSSWARQRPWDASWQGTAAELTHRAVLLGLVDDDGAEPAWVAPLRQGLAVDTDPLRAMLPAEVDKIFLQNDLSAISPGPLAPRLDVRLRTMTVRESAAQASTYRFSADSLTRALSEGEDEASIVEFLGALSLTGIPQPLQYLITQTAARHGLVRIGSDAATGRTWVTSIDEHLIDTIAVDQALRPLGLHREGDALTTRVGAETTYWALTDARYPATVVGDDGAPLVPERGLLDETTAANGAPPVSYAALIARLRQRLGPDADAAWLDRELEAAVRQRALLIVEVGLPDGSSRSFTLEATGLGGGRLRGRDRGADVERTLPVTSIRSARVVDQTTP